MKTNFILYVKDQAKSTEFYQKILNDQPTLNMPGMTEFTLGDHCVLGLMPEKGIKSLLGDSIRDPEMNNGVSRCEIYLTVEKPEDYLERANSIGAQSLSPLSKRNWGDEAGYVMDPDGHIIAFARKLS